MLARGGGPLKTSPCKFLHRTQPRRICKKPIDLFFCSSAGTRPATVLSKLQKCIVRLGRGICRGSLHRHRLASTSRASIEAPALFLMLSHCFCCDYMGIWSVESFLARNQSCKKIPRSPSFLLLCMLMSSDIRMALPRITRVRQASDRQQCSGLGLYVHDGQVR